MPEHLLRDLSTLELSHTRWGIVATVVLVVFLRVVTKKSPSYPPGPPRDPILGNARQMTVDNIELKFTEWGKRYGVSLHSPSKLSPSPTRSRRFCIDAR